MKPLLSKETIDYVKGKQFWVELFLMTGGMFITAVAVHYFLQPSGLAVGSLAGLCVVLNRLTDIPMSVLTFVLNVILLILAYIMIGKEFGTKTVYAALILSPWLGLLEWIDVRFGIDPKTFFNMGGATDYWFYLFGFVVLLSFAQAVLFRINASTGGLDIPAKILNKYLHVDIGTAVTFAGAAVSCSAFFIPGNSLYFVVLGFFGTWINGIVVDYFTAGLNAKKRVCIITKDHEKLRDYIVHDLVRGVSLYKVTGGYTGEEKTEIEAILTNDEFAKLMEKINDEHIDCFITAGRVSEVYGFWIKDKKKYKNLQ